MTVDTMVSQHISNFRQVLFIFSALEESNSSLLTLFVPVPLVDVVDGGRMLGEIIEFPIFFF